MTAYVVRHAKAGDRSDWQGDDRGRPLTKSGRRQAEALASLLKNEGIGAIVSSPYARCVQTVEPLATELHLAVQTSDDLAEGAGAKGMLGLAAGLKAHDPVLCTHGDLVEELLEILIERGILTRARAANEKGGVWILEQEEGEISGAKYLAAP